MLVFTINRYCGNIVYISKVTFFICDLFAVTLIASVEIATTQSANQFKIVHMRRFPEITIQSGFVFAHRPVSLFHINNGFYGRSAQ